MARPDPLTLIPDAKSVSGKAALVTGGTTGIGQATARLGGADLREPTTSTYVAT